MERHLLLWDNKVGFNRVNIRTIMIIFIAIDLATKCHIALVKNGVPLPDCKLLEL